MTSEKIADLFVFFLKQLMIEHEADDPLRVYQLVADKCQAKVNQMTAVDPDRNK
jgi:hypothetical protein